jgi:isopenicillin N synthase-like dioxygenase
MIQNFGFEKLLQSVVERASEHSRGGVDNSDATAVNSRAHFDLKTSETEDDPMFNDFRDQMNILGKRVASILFGDDAVLDVELDGPLSVKSYAGNRRELAMEPPSSSTTTNTRLGAHVDGNMFTILWSNAPGLQVLRPDKEVVADDIMFYGTPLIGVGPSLQVEEEDFVDVEADWSSGTVMLVTVGRSWFSSSNPLTKSSGIHVKCPVLHRVAFPDRDGMRHSVPFLVNVVEKKKLVHVEHQEQ